MKISTIQSNHSNQNKQAIPAFSAGLWLPNKVIISLPGEAVRLGLVKDLEFLNARFAEKTNLCSDLMQLFGFSQLQDNGVRFFARAKSVPDDNVMTSFSLKFKKGVGYNHEANLKALVGAYEKIVVAGIKSRFGTKPKSLKLSVPIAKPLALGQTAKDFKADLLSFDFEL